MTKPTGKFGAFSGVFIPTFLSIIGVILFLRLGLIVGEIGVAGSVLIIIIASSITIATGLSLSSITTNIRIGSGGAYSIISKTLGLEIGGSVGIPLYLSQVFSVALYVFGFSEVVKFLVPGVPTLHVLVGVFALIFALSFASTKLAIRSQLAVFLLILVAFVSVFLGGNLLGVVTLPEFTFPAASFWPMFALFFPAVTGLMSGIGLSGELSDPKKQIPKGVISALLVTTAIYVAMAFWFGHSATSSQLVSSNLIIAELSAYAPVVLLGILAATFSSALTMFMAAPRLMQAMAENSIWPSSRFLARKTRGIPANAMVVTGLIILGTFSLGSLDAVAPVLTMFFLITYSAINIVVFIEQYLGLPSFRPTLKIPKLVPLYGALGSVAAMFLVNALAGLVALIAFFAIYVLLVKRKLKSHSGDIRSGLFAMMSEWAAKRVVNLPEATQHTWKPSVLLPVLTTDTLRGNFPLIRSIVFPHGTMTVLGMDIRKGKSSPEDVKMTKKEREKEMKDLRTMVDKFGEENIFTSFSTVSVPDYTDGITVSLEAVEGQVFNPNVLFLPFNPEQLDAKSLKRIYRTAEKHDTGVALFDPDEDIGVGSAQDVNVWIPESAMKQDFYEDRSFDLAMLIAYTLYRNWNANLTLNMSVSRGKKKAERYLKKLVYEARFPHSTEIHVTTKKLKKAVQDAEQGDIHIVPIKDHDGIGLMSRLSKVKHKSFLFVTDSGKEDVLA